MTPDVLAAENLGKAYFGYASELLRFGRWFGLPFAPQSEIWVVRHASLRVGAGEAVGIVGQNGAGKSTLLKMIVGALLPTEGNVRVHGRVAALLELGLGFNPELTGRENVLHVAGLMGLGANEARELVPRVESFAEVGDYFDQAVRTYSSGMQMRVAFSVATALRPDLLIVDEALAVGDAYFIHKCFQRIREYREAGTALLIVSHDAAAIQSLCDRAILLESGRVILDGQPKEVLDYYNALIAEKEGDAVRITRGEAGTATESGSGEACFESVALLTADGRSVEYVGVGDPVVLSTRARVNQPIDRLVFGYMVRDRLGQPVFGTNTSHTDQVITSLRTGDVVGFTVRFDANFGPGSYSISLALTSTETHLVDNYQWKDLVLVFTVANLHHPRFVGLAYIPPQISVTHATGGAE